MRICIDIDGTICHSRKDPETYRDVKPMAGAIEKIQALKQQGHYLILCTARHMKTCQGNVGKVIALQGQTLLEWLAYYAIPYDELWFGKPWADVYLDDRAFKFTDWRSVTEQTLLAHSYKDEK